jgi:hypothetical protein
MRYIKPIYNFINEEALPLNVAKKYVAMGKNRPSWLVDKLNELFDNQQRIYIPVDYSEDKKVSRTQKEIERILNTNGYSIKNYNLGIAYETKNPKREIRIGKILNKIGDTFNLKLFTEDPDRTLAKQQDDYSIVICQHPYDITAMTTGRSWKSCLEVLEGGNGHFIPDEIKSGTLTVYFIKSSDRNINDPIGRVNVKLYSENDNEDDTEDVDNYNSFPSHWVWIPDTGVYGSFPEEGMRTLKKWLMGNQNYNDGYLYYKISGLYSYSGTAYEVELDINKVNSFLVIEKKSKNEIWDSGRILESNLLEAHYDFMINICGRNVDFYFYEVDWEMYGNEPSVTSVTFEIQDDPNFHSIDLNDLEKFYEEGLSNVFDDVLISGIWEIKKLELYASSPLTHQQVITDLLNWLCYNDVDVEQILFRDLYVENSFEDSSKDRYLSGNEVMKFQDVQSDVFDHIVNTYTSNSKTLKLIDISTIVLTTTYTEQLQELYPDPRHIENIRSYNIIKSKDDMVEDKVNLLIDKDVDFKVSEFDIRDLFLEYFSVDGTKETTYAEISNDYKFNGISSYNFSELTLRIKPEIFDGLLENEGKTFIFGNGEIATKMFDCDFNGKFKRLYFKKLNIFFYGDVLSRYKNIPFKIGNFPSLNKTFELKITNKGSYFEETKLEICTYASTDVDITGINLGNLNIFKCYGKYNTYRNSIRNLTLHTCGLTTLQGIPNSIESLDVFNNELEDLEYLDFDKLEKLDISSNNFKGIEYFDELSSFMIANPNQKLLNLLGNRVIQMKGGKVYITEEIEEYLKTLID